jgi:hypothetical protein
MTVAIAVLVLALIGIVVYLLDRGLANTLEAVAIRLLGASRRLRQRRALIEGRQRESLAREVMAQ